MEPLHFTMLVASLIGFTTGIFGSIVHQHCQRRADKQRWEKIQRQY